MTVTIGADAEPKSGDRWCILRTSGGRTLGLVTWLREVGITAWTPKKTFKRQKPGRCNYIDGKKPTIEIDAPIMPTFVFATADAVAQLLELAADDDPLRPPFSVFTHTGRIPLVGGREIEGLRNAERDDAAALARLREAETREEADRLRIEALRTKRERTKALHVAEAEKRRLLRAERRDFDKGERVLVEEHAAFKGMSGEVLESYGKSAMVFFGGSLTMEIEAWQLARDPLERHQS